MLMHFHNVFVIFKQKCINYVILVNSTVYQSYTGMEILNGSMVTLIVG